MSKNNIRAGQYYACKYAGDNGDLILGKVKSVRRNGEVILENLLTGSRSVKSTSVLSRRNVRVSKRHAAQILQIWNAAGDRKATRNHAVSIIRNRESTNKQVKVSKNKRCIEEIRKCLKMIEKQLDQLES